MATTTKKAKQCTSYVNDKFIPFMSDQRRYNVLYGSAGSSKSVSAAQKIIMRCLAETGTEDAPFRHRYVVIRKFKTSIKQTVYAQIKAVCSQMGIMDYVTCNDSYYNFKFWNGAEIFCIGLDDPEKVKSLVSTSTWMEEATELEEKDFEQIDLRMRGIQPYYQQHIITFNPIDETHWLKRKFFDNPDESMVYILHSTYKDNAFIDENYKKVLEQRFKYDENQYRVYVLGVWGRIKTGSEYYFNFKHDKHVNSNVKLIPEVPLHISFDFNVNPYISATINQIYKREYNGKPYYFVHVIDEFALMNPYNTTERLCEHIIERYKDQLKAKGCFIYGDASGKNKSTRSNISDYDIVEDKFAPYLNNYSLRVPKANPMIKKRRNFMNKLLFGAWNIEFQISPECKKLINDFVVAIEEQDGTKKKQMAKDSMTQVVYEKNGHHADCNDYFLCQAFDRYYEMM